MQLEYRSRNIEPSIIRDRIVCRIHWHSLIRCNRGFSPRRISSISSSLVYVCKNACTNGIVTRSKDRRSTIGNDDSSRWRFIVRVYRGIIRGGRTFCGGSFDESFFTWMHKGNSRHSVGYGARSHRNCIWLGYLLHVGTDVPQEFLLPDKRWESWTFTSLLGRWKDLDRELPLIVANDSRRRYQSDKYMNRLLNDRSENR